MIALEAQPAAAFLDAHTAEILEKFLNDHPAVLPPK